MKMFIFLFPITLFLIFLCLKLVLPDAYISLIQEDSVIEYSQAVFYLLASMIAFVVSMKFLHNKMTMNGILYGILAIGLLFIFLEEVSWGQRVFKIATPVYLEQHNCQKEISIHNLEVVQCKLHKLYMILGAYGAFAWIVAIPFLSKAKATYFYVAKVVVPDWFVSSYFFFTFFIYFLFEYVSQPHLGSFLVWRDQEPAELLLSLGFLSFVTINYVRLRICLSSTSSKVEDIHNQTTNAPPNSGKASQ